jgi:hypothetical protein
LDAENNSIQAIASLSGIVVAKFEVVYASRRPNISRARDRACRSTDSGLPPSEQPENLAPKFDGNQREKLHIAAVHDHPRLGMVGSAPIRDRGRPHEFAQMTPSFLFALRRIPASERVGWFHYGSKNKH